MIKKPFKIIFQQPVYLMKRIKTGKNSHEIIKKKTENKHKEERTTTEFQSFHFIFMMEFCRPFRALNHNKLVSNKLKNKRYKNNKLLSSHKSNNQKKEKKMSLILYWRAVLLLWCFWHCFTFPPNIASSEENRERKKKKTVKSEWLVESKLFCCWVIF